MRKKKKKRNKKETNSRSYNLETDLGEYQDETLIL